MSNLEQRENRRKSIVANMVNEPEQPATSGRGRPRENREKKKCDPISSSKLARGYPKNCLCAAPQF